MTSRASRIARAVIDRFNKLPSKRKPTVRGNGLQEWVPLSGIVAEHDGTFVCLALATGMKCLPVAKLPEANGIAIHDWHAEVLAIRTLNRFLMDECHGVTQGVDSSVLERSELGELGRAALPFRVRSRVRLHMYCSEAPCGDASMELIMAAQQDPSPWEVPAPPAQAADAVLPGRAFFSQLGLVRRKPARGDAPPTLSKSCSDKIALKQCTSLLSSLTSLFIDPGGAYIETLVLPESQYSAVACRRAFSSEGRMKPLAGKSWPGGYAFRPLSIETTDVEFDYSRRSAQARSDRITASNIAATWSLSGFDETIVGGIISGARRPPDPRGASLTSRRCIWIKAKELAGRLDGFPETQQYLAAGTYRDIKEGPLMAQRRRVKDEVRSTALTGWIPNEGDSSFGID